MRVLIIAAVLAAAAIPNGSAAEAASHLPSDQQVLTFIGDSIDWFRQLPSSQGIGPDAADLFFLEDNRPTAMETVRLSFRFGKAVAAIRSPESAPRRPGTRSATPADRELPYLLSMQSRLDASAQRSTEQLRSLTRAGATARGADRKKLEAAMGEVRARIQLLNTISANYQNLADFVRSASAESAPNANLAALVEDLERTIPEASSDAGPPKLTNIPTDASQLHYGIIGQVSRVLALSRKRRSVQTAIDRTNALLRVVQTLRNPFRETFLKQLGSFSSDDEDLSALQKSKLFWRA